MTDRNRRDTFVGRFPSFILLYAWVKFSRILDPAPLFGDPAPKLWDPLEFCSAMSLLVIVHHDSYKYAFITFPFPHVAAVATRATYSIARSLLRQRVRLSVCLSHAGIVCMVKPIWKLLRPSDSPIILVFFRPLCRYPISRVTPSAGRGGAQNTRGCEKLAIFYGNRRLPRKRCEIGRWLLWNVNRKSWVPDWMVSFSMTLSDP